ncbi:hypothetical protein SAMN02745673_00759 [Marinactinospora thermotolerans DSM 45154]|uniref:Uncharacterized protein n=1 Tax=Marinactinospora thermotolerans DSM 45154 TaxID=1122192 RepID=A0A1T4LNI2_9ACTN|nr:hypothetical protein SAMN02745673_00759 [Marinactinospora thermotolerans DSM 45154]
MSPSTCRRDRPGLGASSRPASTARSGSAGVRLVPAMAGRGSTTAPAGTRSTRGEVGAGHVRAARPRHHRLRRHPDRRDRRTDAAKDRLRRHPNRAVPRPIEARTGSGRIAVGEADQTSRSRDSALGTAVERGTAPVGAEADRGRVWIGEVAPGRSPRRPRAAGRGWACARRCRLEQRELLPGTVSRSPSTGRTARSAPSRCAPAPWAATRGPGRRRGAGPWCRGDTRASRPAPGCPPRSGRPVPRHGSGPGTRRPAGRSPGGPPPGTPARSGRRHPRLSRRPFGSAGSTSSPRNQVARTTPRT